MKLIDEDDKSRNVPEYGVSEISASIKSLIESEFSRVRVRGEIGRVFTARSGHLYYDIKDEKSVLAAVTFKGQAPGLAIVPEEGLEVTATGKVTSFGSQSKYQLIVDDLKVAGIGALMAMLEKRKETLQKEGFFNKENKKRIPYIPNLIGVITSPQGAVLSDILHRLRDRFPSNVVVWPVTVQGEKCAVEVSKAIRGFNAIPVSKGGYRPDVLIIARGGGSIEDLWGFNEEVVVREVANSSIPIISAIGHETDTTLIDYASDIRAPTPSAAAEIVVPVRVNLLAELRSLEARLINVIAKLHEVKAERLTYLLRFLNRPEDLLASPSDKLQSISLRMPKALNYAIQAKRLNSERIMAGLRSNLLKNVMTIAQNLFDDHFQSIRRLIGSQVKLKRSTFDGIGVRLSNAKLKKSLESAEEKLEALAKKLSFLTNIELQEKSKRLKYQGQLLMNLSYHTTLERGYSVVWIDKKIISSKFNIKKKKDVVIEFKDGKYLL